jgi:hypothetical protein
MADLNQDKIELNIEEKLKEYQETYRVGQMCFSNSPKKSAKKKKDKPATTEVIR